MASKSTTILGFVLMMHVASVDAEQACFEDICNRWVLQQIYIYII